MHARQQSILRLLADAAPRGLSYSQIGDAIGEPVRQKVWYYVSQLQEKGLARLDPGSKTVYRAAAQSEDPLVSIPLYGAASCGPAGFFADDYIQGHLRVSKRLIDPDLLPRMEHVIGIEASGDSMNRAKVGRDRLPVNDGDYVLVDTMEKRIRNNYVVSVIGDVANIKKARRDEGNRRIELVSESTEPRPPIFLHDLDSYVLVGEVRQVIPKESNPVTS